MPRRCCPLQVILMDHLDWLDDKATKEVAAALAKQVRWWWGGGGGMLGLQPTEQPGSASMVHSKAQLRACLAADPACQCLHGLPTRSCRARPRWQVAPGGRVIWRSAAFVPPYAAFIRDAGFDVKCIQRADQARLGAASLGPCLHAARACFQQPCAASTAFASPTRACQTAFALCQHSVSPALPCPQHLRLCRCPLSGLTAHAAQRAVHQHAVPRLAARCRCSAWTESTCTLPSGWRSARPRSTEPATEWGARPAGPEAAGARHLRGHASKRCTAALQRLTRGPLLQLLPSTMHATDSTVRFRTNASSFSLYPAPLVLAGPPL